MRKMTPEEIRRVIHRSAWAVICAVSPDKEPCAIEATPFSQGEDICFMINPRGAIHRCLSENDRVLVKFTWTGPNLNPWAGVSCMGRGEFDPDPEARRQGWLELGRIMGADYSRAAETLNKPNRSPLLRVRVRSMTGRCSAQAGEPFAPEEPSLPVTAMEE